jgi:hypothetical protein
MNMRPSTNAGQKISRSGDQTPSAPAKGDKTKVRLRAPPKTDRNIDGGQEAGEGIGPEVARLLAILGASHDVLASLTAATVAAMLKIPVA